MQPPADLAPRRPTAAEPQVSRWRRAIPLLLLAAATAAVLATGLHRQISLDALMRHRAEIDAFVSARMATALLTYCAIYVVAVSLSLPASAILTIMGGALFGTVIGGTVALTSATLGAIVIFMIARSALAEWMMRRAGPRAAKLVTRFRSDAFTYLVFLRMIPLFPFWLVNLVSAVCGVSLLPFTLATALGMIPATFAFAFFGASLDSAVAGHEASYRACLAARVTGCWFELMMKAAAMPRMIAGIAVLATIALAPVLVKRLKWTRGFWPR